MYFYINDYIPCVFILSNMYANPHNPLQCLPNFTLNEILSSLRLYPVNILCPSDLQYHGRAPGSILSIVFVCARRHCGPGPLEGAIALLLIRQKQFSEASSSLSCFSLTFATMLLYFILLGANLAESRSGGLDHTVHYQNYTQRAKVDPYRLLKQLLAFPAPFSPLSASNASASNPSPTHVIVGVQMMTALKEMRY